MTIGRTSLALCAASWIAFACFAIARESYIENEGDLDVGDSMNAYYSGKPLTHIAGRPLYAWRSWHGGEAFAVKMLELLNLPSLGLAHLAAEPVAAALFRSSVSYYLVSWVRAWLFVAAATVQWFLIGMLIDGWRRRRRRVIVAS